MSRPSLVSAQTYSLIKRNTLLLFEKRGKGKTTFLKVPLNLLFAVLKLADL